MDLSSPDYVGAELCAGMLNMDCRDTAEEKGQGTRGAAVKEHPSDESAGQCCDLLVIFGHKHDPGFYCVIFFSEARNPAFYWSVP